MCRMGDYYGHYRTAYTTQKDGSTSKLTPTDVGPPNINTPHMSLYKSTVHLLAAAATNYTFLCCRMHLLIRTNVDGSPVPLYIRW